MTIKDLARLSGYSVGTVSRALNGLPNVSEQARSAILALAQERGYQLNTNAKYLKQIHSSGIVAVVTGTSNELFAQMIERIQQTLPTDRYPLTVDYVDENEDPAPSPRQAAQQSQVSEYASSSSRIPHEHPSWLPVQRCCSASSLAFRALRSAMR